MRPALLLGVALCGACESGTPVRVNLSGLGEDTLRMETSLSGARGPRLEFTGGSRSSVGLRLPAAATGVLQVRAEASRGGCLVAQGEGQVEVPAGNQLDLVLRPLTAPLCDCSEELCWEQTPRHALQRATTIAGEIWIAGAQGTVYRLRGAEPVPVPTGTRADLFGLWGTAPDKVWAVGRGVILRYDGTSWTQVLSDDTIWYDIWGRSADELWVVGSGGRILYYTQGVFTEERAEKPITHTLYAVSGNSKEVWAVGGTFTVPGKNYGSTKGRVVLKRDASWTVVEQRDDLLPLRGLWVGEDTAMAAGGYYSGGLVPEGRWRSWVPKQGWGAVMDTTQPAVSLTAASSMDGREIWLAGGALNQHSPSLLRRLDSGAPTSVDLPAQSNEILRSVTATGPGSAVAVGEAGSIIQVDPSNKVRELKNDLHTLYYLGAWAAAADDVWVVGTTGTLKNKDDSQGVVMRWRGSRWTDVTAEVVPQGRAPQFVAVAGGGANDVWLVGEEGKVVHYDGSKFTVENAGVGTDVSLNAVWVRDGAVWIAGGAFEPEKKSLLKRRGETAWSDVGLAGLSPSVFYALWGTDEKNIWVGGGVINGKGVLLRCDASACVRDINFDVATTAVGDWVTALWGERGTVLWAGTGSIGTLGRLMRRNVNGTWTESRVDGSIDRIRGIWGTSATDVWAVGGVIGYLPIYGGNVTGRVYHYDGTVWTPVELPSSHNLEAVTGAGSQVWFAGHHQSLLRRRIGPPTVQ